MDQSSLLLTAKKLIIKHEDLKNHLYKDSLGFWTIAVGYNIQVRGLPTDICMELLDRVVVEENLNDLNQCLWFKTLNEPRAVAIIDLCYNVGFKNLLEFHDMIEAIKEKNYNKAADAMLNSKWAHQVKSRAFEDAEIMRTGMLKD